MTKTATRFFDLPESERRALCDRADAAAMEVGMQAAAEYKARKPDPRAQQYRIWRTMDMGCVLVVKHRDKTNSIEISRDGSYYPHTYLPTSKIIVQPESTKEFILAVVPKWLAHRAELSGVTLPLSPARPWLDEQRETWRRLDNLRMSINTRIRNAGRTPHVKLPFGWTA